VTAAAHPERTFARPTGIALLFAIAVVFGCNHIAARLAFDHGLTVNTAVAARSAVTALGVLALMLAMRVPLALPRPTLGRALAIGAILAVQSYCLYSSVARIPAALALLVFNTHPMLLALLSWAVNGERPPARALVAMPVALAGLALALDLGTKTGGLAGRWAEIGGGVAFAVVAAISFATAMLFTARWLKGIDGRLRSCMTMGTVGVLAFVAGAASGTLAWPQDSLAWTGLVLLTLLYGSAITSLFVLLPKLASPSDIAALNFEPIAVLLIAWALLGQALSVGQIAGALVVVGAIVAMGTAK
jgi:drug/metabolite transporter (DMT)-like permease